MATLGNHIAKVSGLDENRNIVEGDKSRLVSETSDSTFNFMLKITFAIFCGIFGLIVIGDYMTLNEKKRKSQQRQQSKQARKNDKHRDFFNKK